MALTAIAGTGLVGWGRLIPQRAAWHTSSCKYVDMDGDMDGAYRCLLPLLVRGHFKSELAAGGRGPGRAEERRTFY